MINAVFRCFFVVALLSLSCGAFAGKANGATGANTEIPCKVGFSIINVKDAFFSALVQGAREKANELDCEFSVANANDKSQRQSVDVERLIAKGVAGIIVDAPDYHNVVSALDAARKRGVKVVAVDTNAGKKHIDSFVGVKNGQAAADFARYMVKHGLNNGATYGIVDARNSPLQNTREDRFKKVVNKAGAVLKQVVNGKNKNEKAAYAAENLLRSQPDLDYIYTTGTPQTMGAISALTNMSGEQPKVVGWDLNKRIIQGIDDGIAVAIVQQNPRREGKVAMKLMKRLINGQKVKSSVLIPVTIVTSENVDKYRSAY